MVLSCNHVTAICHWRSLTTAVADCRYEISLGDLEVIDLLSSSFIGFPLLSGVVVVISPTCNGSRQSNSTRWIYHQFQQDQEIEISIEKKEIGA